MIGRPQDVYLLTSSPPKRPVDVILVAAGARSSAGGDGKGVVAPAPVLPAVVRSGSGRLEAVALLLGDGSALRAGSGAVLLFAAPAGVGRRDVSAERARRRRDEDELLLLLTPERTFA